MTGYVQYDPRIICLDCEFITYSVHSAERHECLRKHKVVDEEEL